MRIFWRKFALMPQLLCCKGTTKMNPPLHLHVQGPEDDARIQGHSLVMELKAPEKEFKWKTTSKTWLVQHNAEGQCLFKR